MDLSRTARLAALGATLALTAATAVADSPPRPFKVVIDGNANPVFTGPCTITNTETGTGHATHMGTITWQSTENVDACGPDAIVHAEFIITAATGERVTGTYSTIAHLDFMAGEVRAAGLYRITGGTGRFAAASGKGVITAEGSLSPPFGVLGDMTGTIDF
jgi:hypothetical protein